MYNKYSKIDEIKDGMFSRIHCIVYIMTSTVRSVTEKDEPLRRFYSTPFECRRGTVDYALGRYVKRFHSSYKRLLIGSYIENGILPNCVFDSLDHSSRPWIH